MNVALLMIAAAAAAVFLVPKAMKEVSNTAAEHGGIVALSAAFLVGATAFLLLAIRRRIQSPTFQSLKQEKQNLYLEVLRDGERVKVSVSNIVVGDTVLSEVKDKL
ncbi:hypothetical protein Syun_024836 [Stephania yunnanensis]|uniref:Uncharacterized protein n=1 Tax=Stephania yunnanensis TaxID=152371 RepID=A0AAP0EQI1_9MAGN